MRDTDRLIWRGNVIRSLDAEPGRRPVMRRGAGERGRRSGPGMQPGRHDGLIARG
jgi:hypothetical protein